PASLPGLAELVPDFRLAVDDLARASDDDLQARALATFPMLALALLRDGHSESALFTHLEEWAAAFAAVAVAPTGLQAFAKLMRYLELRLSEQQFERFRVRLAELAPTTEDVIMRFTERVFAEGEAKGKAEGKAEGEAKGKAEGRSEAQRETLVKLLSLKFAPLEESTLARVRVASPDELERWIERILAAPNLAAVFEP
ncbi:MAG TPA: hypothetical protein VFG69_06950, partial [Nannocystaceae bacterium]|nr:hypothetical protein [Nannocystaceae bacterium]